MKGNIYDYEAKSKKEILESSNKAVNKFKRGFPPRNCLISGEKYHVLSDFKNIFNGRQIGFFSSVKFYGLNNVRQTTIHIVEPPVPKPNPFDFETRNLNLKHTNHQDPIIFNWKSLQRKVEL